LYLNKLLRNQSPVFLQLSLHVFNPTATVYSYKIHKNVTSLFPASCHRKHKDITKFTTCAVATAT